MQILSRSFSMDIYDKFKIIEAYFKELDEKTKQKHGKPFFDTTHGIWGATSMLDAFELFMKLSLDEKKGFVDLGSGDGRIVFIAGLFTEATGIEADPQLNATALQAKGHLTKKLPELERCILINADYTTVQLHTYEILFTFCDHAWSPNFEEKLQKECKGVLLSYNRIFLPEKLKKGKTYWMQQIPIISYHLNTPEKDLLRVFALPDEDEQDHDHHNDRNTRD
jgi:hypothetical protein